MGTYFIFGHLDMKPEEFEAHYAPRIRAAMDAGASFVVGDARGADAMAQAMLAAYERDKVTVFHMFTTPRHNLGPFPTRGGFASDRERDEAMTAASTADIAWVSPGREKSGTAKSLARRSG
jgi:hypothetical protein